MFLLCSVGFEITSFKHIKSYFFNFYSPMVDLFKQCKKLKFLVEYPIGKINMEN